MYDAKKYVNCYHVKRAKNKVLKVKLKAKFAIYSFIPAKAAYLEIPGLDLARNTLLILLCSTYFSRSVEMKFIKFIMFFN